MRSRRILLIGLKLKQLLMCIGPKITQSFLSSGSCRFSDRQFAVSKVECFLRTVSHSHLKSEWLLPGIFGRPKLLRQVTILSVTGTVNRDALALLWLDAVTLFEDFLSETHFDYLIRRRLRLFGILVGCRGLCYCQEKQKDTEDDNEVKELSDIGDVHEEGRSE